MVAKQTCLSSPTSQGSCIHVCKTYQDMLKYTLLYLSYVPLTGNVAREWLQGAPGCRLFLWAYAPKYFLRWFEAAGKDSTNGIAELVTGGCLCNGELIFSAFLLVSCLKMALGCNLIASNYMDFTEDTSLSLDQFYEMFQLKQKYSPCVGNLRTRDAMYILTFPLQCTLTNFFLFFLKHGNCCNQTLYNAATETVASCRGGRSEVKNLGIFLLHLFIQTFLDRYKLVGCQNGNTYQHTQIRIVRRSVKTYPNRNKQKSPVPQFWSCCSSVSARERSRIWSFKLYSPSFHFCVIGSHCVRQGRGNCSYLPVVELTVRKLGASCLLGVRIFAPSIMKTK